MFGTATFTVEPRRVLTVPRDAVVDTGRHQHVYVRDPSGRLAPRTVQLGARVGERIAIEEGLTEGEQVVASGVFVIDSESRLRSSGGTGHQHGEPDDRAPPGEHAGHGE
jgi:hypothetical protein